IRKQTAARTEQQWRLARYYQTEVQVMCSMELEKHLNIRLNHCQDDNPGKCHEFPSASNQKRKQTNKKAPAIVVPPKRIHNVTGAQVYLSCEVKAVPTPIITWKKVTESPKGVKLLEDLPGDRVNMAIQVRGGPSKHESTGWVLINPLTKEDEGVYQCHATNMVGETQAEGNIKVLDHSRNKKPNPPGSEDRK
ncbi:hypothetical protein JRQ81_013107, partial [Phrynocephalus forsythii]